MENFIVYIDDAEHAERQIIPMLASHSGARWILVGCPPRLHRHAGRWLTQPALKRWRQDWTHETVGELARLIRERGDEAVIRTAHGPLADFTRQLKGEWGLARVLDARRPKLGTALEPVTAEQPADRAASPLALTGGAMALGVAIATATE